jgi:hypothetical protein
MEETNATQPNAFHAEALEKRKLAAQYADEANVLEAKAKELEEAANPKTQSQAVSTQAAQPEETGTSDEPKTGGNKLFNKK